MALWFRRREVVCRDAVELVTDYLEGALSRRDRERLEAHLAECPHCTEYFEQFRVTIRAIGRIEPDSLAPQVREDLIELYRRWSA